MRVDNQQWTTNKLKEYMDRIELDHKTYEWYYKNLTVTAQNPIREAAQWIQAQLPRVKGWTFECQTNIASDIITLYARNGSYQCSVQMNTTKVDPFPSPDVAMLEFMDLDKAPRVHRARGELLREALEFCAYEQKIYAEWKAKCRTIETQFKGATASQVFVDETDNTIRSMVVWEP